MKKIAVFFLPVCLALIGCSSLNQPIDQVLYDNYLTRTYDSSKAKLFEATLAALKELNVGVEKVDKEKGLITTERVDFYNQIIVSGYGYSASGQSVTGLHKYYLAVSGDDQSSTVRALKYRLWANSVEQTELNAAWCKENVWDPLFNEIQAKLEGY